jgi:hypothetical protein
MHCPWLPRSGIANTARLSGLRKNATKRRKSFLQGLKPVESTRRTSALKHRPPEEKDFFRSLRRRALALPHGLWKLHLRQLSTDFAGVDSE